MTDAELLAGLDALRQGDRTAFERIYQEMSTPLFTVILRILRDRNLAEDVLQELFVKLFRSPPSVRKPRAYLFQSARNLAIDTLRRRPEESELNEQTPAPDHTEAQAERLDLRAALDALPLAERQIVSLHINGGLKFRGIAAMMGLPLGTALWKYQKALNALRAALSP